MKKVTLMIPVYNESAVLPTLYPQIALLIESHPEYEWEVLSVNDGSTDNSLAIMHRMYLEDERFCYVDLSRNFGKEKAMMAGFDYATGDCVINMDADMQDPPEVIHKMLKLWEEGYDDIYGHRISRGKESFMRRIMTGWFYRMLQSMAKVDVLPNVGDFRLLDRKCVDALRHLRESERYTKGLYCWIGFRKAEVEFHRNDRAAGKSSWSILSLFNLAIEGITTFTTTPLRLASVAGIITAFASLLLMLYYFIKTIIWGDTTSGFPTLVVLILFLGSVQLIALGIIGEYLGRVFVETKNRPVYIVRDYKGNKQQ